MSEHTKEKWEVLPYTRRDGDKKLWITTNPTKKRTTMICRCTKELYVKRILKCVNSHDELLAACKALLSGLNNSNPDAGDEVCAAMKIAKQAIKNAS